MRVFGRNVTFDKRTGKLRFKFLLSKPGFNESSKQIGRTQFIRKVYTEAEAKF